MIRYGGIAVLIAALVIVVLLPFATSFVESWSRRDVDLRSQLVFNAALRTHDIKVLHQIHICVGVFEKLICWYKEALPLLATAIAMNETYPYMAHIQRQRAQWAYEIIANIMHYTSDYGEQGVEMRNAIHAAFVHATVPQTVMDAFQHYGFVQANKSEGCNGPNDDLVAQRELQRALEEAWGDEPQLA